MSSFLNRLVRGKLKNAHTSGGEQSRQDNGLALSHLKRIFSEFRHPSADTTIQSQEDKLYSMIPLFNRVFNSAPPIEMTERFHDVLQFSSHAAKLMVSEIKKRATNLSTDEACLAIVQFLEIGHTQAPSRGWQLFMAIDTLSAGSHSIIDCMSAVYLPSTLVKCLYLFFDLPPVTVGEGGGDVTPAESRLLLQRTFVQVLVRMCSHMTPAEELARSDDLQLLFSAISSVCPAYNHMWRKSAAEVLMTISRHGLTNHVVQYIHDKKCVSDCINNMQTNSDLSPLEVVDMFVTVFCFLKDSCEVSQTLLDDFRSCDGYLFLIQFLLQLEEDSREETIQAMRNLVLLVGSLTTCGHVEITPTHDSSTLFKLEGFTLPKPVGKGISVRNIQAFKVLQSVFIKSRSSQLCMIILEVISSIFHQDNSNYFIVEPQGTLSEFAETIHHKPHEVQVKYFELIEFIVTNLNFVPCKELNGMSLLLKANKSIDCSVMCMKTLLKILDYEVVYKKVFSEVGLLEVLITCLHRFAATVKEHETLQGEGEIIDGKDKDLGFMVMNALAVLLSGTGSLNAETFVWSNDHYNQKFNEDVFRQCGGARCAHNLVPYEFCRRPALSLVKQLLLSSGGDDDMGTLLALMQKEPHENIQIKVSILRVIISAMRESHRARTMFRKVDGFRYIMSVIVAMNGCLGEEGKAPWCDIDKKSILTLLQAIFCTLTVAMRYEPTNIKFFKAEVQYSSLLVAVRLLGCFTDIVELPECSDSVPSADPVFQECFLSSSPLKIFCTHTPENVPVSLLHSCFLFRCLYDMAVDHFDSRVPEEKPVFNKRMTMISDKHSSADRQPLRSSWNGSVSSIKLDDYDHTVIHPGALSLMLKLLPSINISADHQLALNLQMHITRVIQSLLNTDRNQQSMCNEGFVRDIFTHCTSALLNENHILHSNIQYMFELMAAQSLKPNDLRDYLRLGDPLCCKSLDELSDSDTPRSSMIPVNRVRCLVTMTTPRDVNLHGLAITPPFVEFNMNYEGFSCMYIPSMAPQGPPNPSVVGVTGSTDQAIVGGIGTGERVFPPAAGLSYCTWFCIDRISSSQHHPVYLLQIVRRLTDQSDSLLCLSISVDCRDKALIISTQEKTLPAHGATGVESSEKSSSSDSDVRVWCPQLVQEGSWQHLSVVFAKSGMLKNSSVALYLNGTHLSTHKLHYISPNIGSTYGTAQSATSVSGYIGTPAQLRCKAQLVWKQGPCILIEEALSAAVIEKIYTLGPNYVGCLQSVPASKTPSLMDPNEQATNALVSEDKVMFFIHADASSMMTVSKIKKIYNKFDGKAIASQLSTASQENTTPVRVIYNSASHLSGMARPLGAVVIGFTGVHLFHPQPVATVLNNIGGMSIMLGFVAMSNDVEGLYAAVKALVCVMKSTKAAYQDMIRINGYSLLAMLYKKKQALLNSHILHLTFSLIGTIDSNKEITIIPNRVAFEDLLCDLEVWHDAPSDLQRSLYDHFYELLTETSGCEINRTMMREARLVKKILYVMRDSQLSKATVDILCRVLQTLLYNTPDKKDVLRFGQFVVSTLPELSLTEDQIVVESSSTQTDSEDSSVVLSHNIRLRNCCLKIVYNLLLTDINKKASNPASNIWVIDTLVPVLGYDWLMLFMQSHLHKSTVVLSVEILFSVLTQSADCMTKYRDGVQCAGWLDNTQQILDSDSVPHGVNLESSNSRISVIREVNKSVCNIPGFISLQWLLQSHCNTSDIYYLLGCLLVNKEIRLPANNTQLRTEDLCGHFLSNEKENRKSKTTVITWNQEPAVIILCMVKCMMNMAWQTEEEGSWLREYPITLIQLLLFMYQKHNAHFKPIAMSADFLSALASTLFQQRSSTATSSARSTPVHMSSSSTTTPTRPTAATRSSSVLSQSGDDSADLRSHRDAAEDLDLSEAWTESTGGHSLLTDHLAKKQIIELIMKIILDSFAMPASKNTQVVEIVLNTCPSHCSKREQAEFQTAILKLIMDYLLAVDILLGEQATVQLYSSNSFSHIVAHVFFFTNLVVDKLWKGSYNKDAKEIFEFVKELLAQGKRRTSALNLDTLYNCLNRTILFELSGKTDSAVRRTAVLDSLHRLTDSRSLVFGAGNYDLEFVGCLTHCLLELTSDRHEVSCEDSNTQWHVAQPVYRSDSLHEGIQLLVIAATRVWQDLYVHKKPAIEEALKISLSIGTDSNPSPRISTPDLNSLREKLADPAAKLWTQFYENQKRSGVRADVERFHSQVQSRLERVGSGVIRLATGKKVIKDLPLMKQTSIIHDEYIKWISNHTSIIRELVDHHMTTYELDNHHMHEFIHENWLRTERELLRERGVWGPDQPSVLDKYLLDMTEGPTRMRMKMEKNENFYKHYPYRVKTDLRQTKYKSPVSRDSEAFYMSKRVKSLIEDETVETTLTNQNVSIDTEQDPMTPDSSVLTAPSLLPRGSICKSDTLEDDELTDAGSASTDDINQSDSQTDSSAAEEAAMKSDLDNNQTLLRILDEGEKIGQMFRCARVQGLDSVEAIMLFGKERFYILDGFTLLATNQIQDIDSIAEEYRDPIIPRVQGYTSNKPTETPTTKKLCMKFYYEDIREVLKRRYLLQPIALEVFNSDGRNILLAFPPSMRNKILAKFVAVAPSLTNNSLHSVAGQKQSTKMEAGGGIISSLISEKSVTSRWERGEISNFQYLMHLNTLAGRSYNDLMQYPVFPWILADYSSETLDLTKPETFRDLSKPMGALTPNRLDQFKKRFKEWDDPTGETPAYHYGTHYSSAMIVASYLVRMEPFTQHFLSLQGGHFDLADRMFHTIKEAYESASKTNMADVKELIPEFFYLPDFLLNSNKFELGEKQSGVRLNDIGLPPWAKGDAREFVRVHREALESEYVSANLHQWIDLIFGYKQQGKAAVEAYNVFHYLFYEGNVDIYSIDDPLKRNAIIGFINNFGQIPKQLFKKPHPQKRELGVILPTSNYSITSEAFFFSNPDCLSPNMAPIKELRGPVGQIIQTDRAVLAVEENKVLMPPNYNKYIAWGFSDLSLRMCAYDSEKASVVLESLENSELFCACTPNSKTLITAGSNTVVNVWKMTDTSRGKSRAVLRQPLYGHTAPVLCMSASTAFNILVSGSVDKTCIVWDLSRLRYVTQLTNHRGPVSAVCINNLTGVIASCSASWLYLWSVNGEKLASVDTANTAGPLKINCVCMTEANEWDADNLILTGSSDGVVRMWSLSHVQTSTSTSSSKSDSHITHSQSCDTPTPTSTAETSHEHTTSEGTEEQTTTGNAAVTTANHQSTTDGETGGTRPVPAARRSLSLQSSNEKITPVPRLRRNTSDRGKQWKRQLVFRSKLTMHTAYERRDNKHPAAITTISCSRDHRTIFVGDEKGRVLSWSMIETSGPADHWVKDEVQQACTQCDTKFTPTIRRHHCRNCGQIFCSKCSKYESEIPHMKIHKPVRVCLTCYKTLDMSLNPQNQQ